MPLRANQYLYCTQKNSNELFFQCQMYSIEKTIPLTTACLVSFFGNDNYIITLLQSIMICIFVNNKRINSETIILYNDVIHSKNTISFVFLVNKYTLSNPSHWNSTFAVSFIYKEFWWKEWGTVENHTIIWINTSLFVFICQAMVKNTILV
jgi:hypothetical protein